MGERDVLVVLAGTEGYGVRRGTLALATALGTAGFNLHFAAVTAGPVFQELVSLGYNVVHLTSERLTALSGGVARRTTQLFGRLGHAARISRELYDVIEQTRPMFLYFRVPSLVLPVGLASRKRKVRAFWHMPNVIGSGYPWALNRRLYWAILDHSPMIPLANSEYTAATLNRGGDYVPVLHVGTDEMLFNPERVASPISRDDLSIPSDAVVFGIVARLVEDKGQRRFLESLLLLPKDVRGSIHLVLIGGPIDSPYAAAVREMAGRAGLDGQVHLVGAVPDPERYYSLMDIAVSSRLDAEPYGQSVVEAMMMARPVLAHAFGGPAVTVLDGTTGWHIETPDRADFAAGILRALRERSRWTEMGRQARRHALDNYSLKIQVARLLELACIPKESPDDS